VAFPAASAGPEDILELFIALQHHAAQGVHSCFPAMTNNFLQVLQFAQPLWKVISGMATSLASKHGFVELKSPLY
jgi:hypothetical protein